MIDEIRPGGVEGQRGGAPVPPARPGSAPPPQRSERPLVELRNRLSGIAGELETFLEQLAQLQDRSGAGSEILDRIPALRRDPAAAREIRDLARRAHIDLPGTASPDAVAAAARNAIDESARGREALERSISSAQVALQNILSVDNDEPRIPPGASPVPHGLEGRNVLQLLDPA